MLTIWVAPVAPLAALFKQVIEASWAFKQVIEDSWTRSGLYFRIVMKRAISKDYEIWPDAGEKNGVLSIQNTKMNSSTT